VRRAEIKAGTRILKSHMFVVKKYLANGSFDKMKARLVVDGRDQDTELYPDKSSPMVAVHLVFTALGLASSKPWHVVMKIDIKGAFGQTPMKGEPVYMKICSQSSEKYWKMKAAFTHFLGGFRLRVQRNELLCIQEMGGR